MKHYKKLYGEKHPTVGSKYYNLGLVEKVQKNYKSALKYYKKSLKIKIETLNINHPSIARVYNNIGNILKIQQKNAMHTFWNCHR